MKILEAEYKGTKVRFNTRPELLSDEIVVTEMFRDNTYRIDNLNGTVIDIGANIGTFAVQAILAGAEKVYAYEPEDENYKLLIENIKLNKMEGKIIPIKKGVYCKSGKTQICSSGGGSTIEAVFSLRDQDFSHQKVFNELELVTLDSILNEVGEVEFLKIDCEGSEYGIIDGWTQLDKVKNIAMEFHGINEVLFGDMIIKLMDFGYINTIGRFGVGGLIFAKSY